MISLANRALQNFLLRFSDRLDASRPDVRRLDAMEKSIGFQ